MKQVRVLSVFALLFNLAIIGMVGYASAVLLGQEFLNCIHFFTILSNVLIALVALICVPFNLIGIFKGKTLPKGLYILKLIATTLIGITFFVATFFLSYLDNWDIAKQYGNFQLNHVNFYYHLLVPAVSMLTFIFFDRAKKTKFPVNFLSLIPLSAYCGFYGANYFLEFYLDPLTNKYDWYGFTEVNGLTGAIILLAILLVFAFVLSTLLWLLNKLLSRSIQNEEAEPQLAPQAEPQLVLDKQEPEEEQLLKEQEPVQEESEAVEAESEEVHEEPNVEAESEEVHEEPVIEEDSQVEEAEEEQPQEEEPAPAPKKPATPKKATTKKPASSKKPAAPKPETEKKPSKEAGGTKVYHLTKRKEDDMWAITFVGGKKPVKLFKTKKEAEEYLAILTKNQGATALIRNSKGAKAGKFASSIKSDEDKK